MEELPRRSCYKNATVARITVWATPEKVYFTGQERISLPPTGQDRRPLESEGSIWSLTMFRGTLVHGEPTVVEQKWSTVADLEPGFAAIPFHEVGRLPGDRPAPFRDALGKAQWRWAETRKLLEFMSGKLVTEVTTSREEQQRLGRSREKPHH